MKVVKVLWIDSCNSNLNWTIAEDIEIEPIYINSFGVVVKDTDEFLAIAQNYGDNPEQYSNITTIPKGCIKKVFVIHEDKMYENEKKSSDKVEPKFKVGDWVTDGYIHYKITEILYDRYIIESKYSRSAILFEHANRYHLWTIEDAKDGDVLASKDGFVILIFKNLYTNISFSSYYNTTGKGEFGWSSNCFIPATKEQRDKLFHKMKKAGYEWDSEKKELKKK